MIGAIKESGKDCDMAAVIKVKAGASLSQYGEACAKELNKPADVPNPTIEVLRQLQHHITLLIEIEMAEELSKN